MALAFDSAVRAAIVLCGLLLLADAVRQGDALRIGTIVIIAIAVAMFAIEWREG